MQRLKRFENIVTDFNEVNGEKVVDKEEGKQA